jgi:hypothetical protein
LIPLGCRGKSNDQFKNGGESRQMNINPADLVGGMNAATFFQTMLTAMYMNPPWIADPEMNKKLATLVYRQYFTGNRF